MVASQWDARNANAAQLHDEGYHGRRPPQQAKLTGWPDDLRAAWQRALALRSGPFQWQYRRFSPETVRGYATCVTAFVRFLIGTGRLTPDGSVLDSLLPDCLNAYFIDQRARGRADFSILTSFKSLASALKLMFPEKDFKFITNPEGIPLRRALPMRRRDIFVPDARHNVFWAEQLFKSGLAIADPTCRRVQVRDAVIIGIFANRAPRLRAMSELRLGLHLQKKAGEWHLLQDDAIMKDRDMVLELPLGARISALVDRYIEVERRELLGDKTSDRVWIARYGEPLGKRTIADMIARRSFAQYGVSFGPHRFRTSLTTTRAIVGGDRPFDAALILGHSAAVSLAHYNRARNLEASRDHDARVSELEDTGPRKIIMAARRQPLPRVIL